MEVTDKAGQNLAFDLTPRLQAKHEHWAKHALVQVLEPPPPGCHVEGCHVAGTLVAGGQPSFRLPSSAGIHGEVTSYLTQKFAELHSPNKFKVYMGHGGKPWVSDFSHPHYMAGRRALKTDACRALRASDRTLISHGRIAASGTAVAHGQAAKSAGGQPMFFGVEPDLTREGGSIPVTLTFQEATGKNVMLLPVGSADDGAHSQNEKLNRRNYIEGTKMLAAYLYEVSQLKE
ncbi:Metallopeptidase M20 [Saguinus oedipus]|uniref:Metallopeptidase M20 n=1 Tax=Saguinus oedipus TaxID=9490 RepID=A0ABQ9UB20_SAGOE|nr:Metallopeptidase M20 [Saguinus oedipus]